MADNSQSSILRRHPVLANAAIIVIVAVLGILIVYFSIAIFTHHGQLRTVPKVENMSYSEAIQTLHEAGLRYEIRDSLFLDDVKPGYVVEQFPKTGSMVKPGRKVFLYINSVTPKMVVLDDDNHPREYALAGSSERSAKARLEELGFKNVRVVRVLGINDMVIRILANGLPVRKMQKIPVNSTIVIELSDGRLSAVVDSLTNLENRSLSDSIYHSSSPTDEEYDPDYHYSEPTENPGYIETEEEETNEFLE